MQEVLALLDIVKSNSFEKCLELSFNVFYREYNHKITNLTYNYPIKCISVETQLPLWSGLKKFPHPIEFNPNHKNHVSFLYVYSVILAQTLGIKYPEKDENFINETLKRFSLKEHTPVVNITNKYNEEIVKEIIRSQDVFFQLKRELMNKDNSTLSQRIFSPAILKLDNETSIHIDFINIAANIRGSNYDIEEVNKDI
jgi:ubiquitin-activating enzyme E1